MQFTRLAHLALASIVFALLGCKGGGTDSPVPAQTESVTKAPEAPPPQAPAPQAPPATADAQGIVHLTADDQMRYSATRIEIKAGEKLKLELKNLGVLAKEAMGHNFVLLKPGTKVTDYVAKAMSAKATDYIPADAADMIIGHTKLLGPGESDTLETPALAAGSYPFLCSFPGHFALMTGELIVK